MSDIEENSGKETVVKTTIDVVTGLAKAVPIYDDAVQPAAKEVGKALETITKTINLALAPVKVLVWGYEQIEGFVNESLSKKLQKTPNERIITPPIEVVGPAFEALRFTGHNEDLRNLFGNLIANSMDVDMIKKSHPGFVEIIKNLSSEEAKILKIFAKRKTIPLIDIRAKNKDRKLGGHDIVRNYSEVGQLSECKAMDLIPNFLDNLCRLGLLEIPSGMYLIEDEIYNSLEKSDFAEQIRINLDKKEDFEIDFKRKYITLTNYGLQFCETCVIDKK